MAREEGRKGVTRRVKKISSREKKREAEARAATTICREPEQRSLEKKGRIRKEGLTRSASLIRGKEGGAYLGMKMKLPS